MQWLINRKAFPLIGLIALLIFNLSCQQYPVEEEIDTTPMQEALQIVPPIHLPILEGNIVQVEEESGAEEIDSGMTYDTEMLPHNTAEIFLLSEGLMDLGRLSQVDFPLQESMPSHSVFLTELGHKIISEFYDTPGNYTIYDPSYTPYIQSALYITEAEEDQFLFRNIVDQLEPVINPSENVILNMPVEQCPFLINREVAIILDGEIEKYNLDCYFDKIRDFLRNIDNAIEENIPEASDSLIDSIRDMTEGEGQYMVLLNRFQDNVEKALSNKNADGSDKTYQQILVDLELAYNDFLNELFNTESVETIAEIRAYINCDTNIRENTERSTIQIFKEEIACAIKDGLVRLSGWRAGIATYFQNRMPDTRAGFNLLKIIMYMNPIARHLPYSEGIDSLNDIAYNVENIIHSFILIEHGNKLNEYLPQIPGLVAPLLRAALEEQTYPNNVYDAVHNVATEKAEEIIFGDRETLPGIELSDIAMIRDGQQVRFSQGSLITNGTTLGTAMSALMERLKGLDTFEDIPEGENKDYQLLFSLLNKSIKMIGAKRFIPIEGIYSIDYPVTFFRPIWREQHQTRQDDLLIDSYFGNYYNGSSGSNLADSQPDWLADCPSEQTPTQQGYFAIPDRIVLTGTDAFDIDLEAMHQEPMVSTVLSQAEIIRGAAKALRYFRPDILTEFALGMGSERYESEVIFPVASVFNLHLALAAVNLKNLGRRGLSVYDNDMNSTFIHTMIDNPNVPEGTYFASVHDVVEGEDDFPYVRTLDMARLMMAINEFVSIAEEIRLGDISEDPTFCYAKKYIMEVKDSIALLDTVSFGLNFFMISKLQREDGSFASQYDVPARNIMEQPVSLEVQVQTMRALISLYNRAGGDSIKSAILQSFNYITSQLFDTEGGFYVAFEGSQEKPDLRLITDFLRLLYVLEPLIEDVVKRQQFRELRQHWVSDFAQELRSLGDAL